jgi:NAD(P) transhydrogenase
MSRGDALSEGQRFDALVIGSGPAGQKAAIQFAKAGCDTLIVERSSGAGGECVHRGTIPSKTLRETALYLTGLRNRSEGVFDQEIRSDLKVESLMRRQDAVRRAHERLIADQIERNGIALVRGRARFASPHDVEITGIDGRRRTVCADVIVIATGSRPRTPPNVPIDHESVLDSDSLLSLIYLPATLTVLGAGVIACEFASIFAALGVRVTMIDKGERPLAFMDPELTEAFVADFERRGGRWVAKAQIESVVNEGISGVTTRIAGGEEVRTQKLLCALGRVAQVTGLAIEVAGVTTTPHGHVEVDASYRTRVPHIYAVGDVIGPPALAATSMEQGRRAARHALGLPLDASAAATPIGIYTIPEMAAVGATEREAIAAHGDVVVGRARFAEVARGQIAGSVDGLLKLVARASDGRLLGAHAVGEGATELIHVAQIALVAGLGTDTFIENIFNFPTLAEGYRVAALDIDGQRSAWVARAA